MDELIQEMDSLFKQVVKYYPMNDIKETKKQWNNLVEALVKLSKQENSCNKPAVIVPLPDSVEAYKLADIAENYLYEGVTGELRIGTKGIIAIIEEYNKMQKGNEL